MKFDHPDFITSRIPHRPPFLWLDRILKLDDSVIVAEKHLPADLELFVGHYPDYPIMPGVLLCEAVFQAGALLIAESIKNEGWSGIPVLTRITNAKFKREVHPQDTIVIQASIKEKMGSAWFMKGLVKVSGKIAIKVEFSCALKTT